MPAADALTRVDVQHVSGLEADWYSHRVRCAAVSGATALHLCYNVMRCRWLNSCRKCTVSGRLVPPTIPGSKASWPP